MTDVPALPIGADDPRWADLLELRARQLLIFAVEVADDVGLCPLAATMTAAFQELGPGADVELLRRSFTLTLAAFARLETAAAEFVDHIRAPILDLLTKIEGTQQE